jgi:hypothetical protein
MARIVLNSVPAAERAGAAGKPNEVHMRLSSLAKLLGGVRYRYGSEVQLHEVMADLLTGAGYEFVREHRLDAKNRADFWLDGIVIEVKVDGSAGDALRQVDRYISLPQVQGVLLAGTPVWASTPLAKYPAWQDKAFHLTRLQRQAL